MKPIVTDYAPITPLPLSRTPSWSEVLKQGTIIVDKYFKNWQLGFGSLLGGIREEQQFISHDIDLDIDVLLRGDESDEIESFIEEMVKDGFKPLRRQEFKYKELLTTSIAFLHPTRVIFDVCFFRRWGNDYLHIGKEGLVIRPNWSIERKRFTVKDVNCYIPIEYDKYLTGRYGDWRTPVNNKQHWNDDAAKGNLFIPMDFGVTIKEDFK